MRAVKINYDNWRFISGAKLMRGCSAVKRDEKESYVQFSGVAYFSRTY